MTTHAFIKRTDGAPGKAMLGDVLHVGEGAFDRFRSPREKEADQWRAVVVDDAPVDFWVRLLRSVEVGDKTVLRRGSFVDIQALEDFYMRQLGRLSLVPDEIINVNRETIEKFTHDRNAPSYPGLLR